MTAEHSNKNASQIPNALNHLQKQLIVSGTPIFAGYPTVLIIFSRQMSTHHILSMFLE